MAKKGGVQQLQAELNTDEDFEKFLEKEGLLVLDVYTEWCGPCLGMVGSLKKIKLEIGGDNLQLAIAKSDEIDVLKRFRNRSEPTWLFLSTGKVVNLMFGTNVPMLMKLITDELDLEIAYREGSAQRKFYDLYALTPEEQRRADIKAETEERAIRLEKEEADKKRKDYITYVTNEIMEHVFDMSITVFMPHVDKNIYKKLLDPADKCALTCKERTTIQITENDLEVLNFDCENPIPEEILQEIMNKDLFAIIWKIADTDLRPVDDVIALFINLITEPQPILDEFGNPDPELKLPPLIKSQDIYLKTSEENFTELLTEEEVTTESMKENDINGASAGEEIENDELVEEEEDKRPKITIPAVWSPKNRRGQASLIYLFFRNLTDHFLPPDPVPDPPHLAIGFDAIKRRDVFEVCDIYPDAILAYGFFTNTDLMTTELIAKTTDTYYKKKPTINDKIILKVAKVTSHAILALGTLGPCFVSQNTVEGKEECAVFFPENYNEVIDGEEEEQVETKKKRKRKGKKKECDPATEVCDEEGEFEAKAAATVNDHPNGGESESNGGSEIGVGPIENNDMDNKDENQENGSTVGEQQQQPANFDINTTIENIKD